LDKLNFNSYKKNNNRYYLLKNDYRNGIHIYNGNVLLSKNSIIYPNTTFIGEIFIGNNCRIGPNTVILGPTILEENIIIGPHSEVRRSIIMKNTKINHVSYIGHSILGRNVNIAANVITAVRNLKRKTVHLLIDNKLFDTKEELFGVIIADNVEFGVNVTIMPGRMILIPCSIKANSIIKNNINNIHSQYIIQGV
ncbi:MAG: hypothetical protein ACFFG0_50875, partial [Candidatus Thorarchaeota archaeon]